jgi:hypothetical protein
MRTVQLLALCALLAACASGREARLPSPAPACRAWHFGGPGSDQVDAVALGPSGHVVLAGSFEREFFFGTWTLASAGEGDAFIAMLDPSGLPLWARQLGGAGHDVTWGVALDASGDVFAVGGWTDGTLGCFVARLAASDGHVLWQRHLRGTGPHLCRDVVVLGTDELVVASAFAGTLEGPGGPWTSAGSNDLLLTWLSTSDGEVRRVRHFGGKGNELARAVDVDAQGRLVLGGQFSGEVPPSEGTLRLGRETLRSAGDFDALLVQLDAAGEVRWTWRQGDVGFDLVKSLAVEPSGDVLVSGVVQPPMDFQGKPPLSMGIFEGFVARLSPEGQERWRQRFSGPVSHVHQVASDGAGGAWMAGHFQDTLRLGDTVHTARGKHDVFVAHLGPDGRPDWSQGFGTEHQEFAYALAARAGAGAVLAGPFQGTLPLCGEPLTSRGAEDVYLLHLLQGPHASR